MEDATKLSFERELAALATLRDELKLKAHLAKSELKDELTKLESKWQRVDEEVRRTSTHAKSDVQAIGDQAKSLLNELKQGYESVKRQLG